MEWENLKEEKCPKCGAFLDKGAMYSCRFCGFRISLGKAFSIIGQEVDLQKDAKDLLKKKRSRRKPRKRRLGRGSE